MFSFLAIDYFSLLLPLGYLTTLIGSLGTFSYLYRRRQALKAATLEPWFPPHLSRSVYLSLLELSSSPSSEQKVPDSLLRAALLRRAVEDIRRLISLRNAKPALTQLLQRGSVGDELMQRFAVAEKEMEAELKEVVEEANALSQGPVQWGQYIFQSASECVGREMLDKQLEKVEETRAEEKEQWERRRESVREGFMKELEAPTVETPIKKEEKDRKGSKAGSDESDVVVVEAGGPEEGAVVKEEPQSAQSTPSTPASSKKKKTKK